MFYRLAEDARQYRHGSRNLSIDVFLRALRLPTNDASMSRIAAGRARVI